MTWKTTGDAASRRRTIPTNLSIDFLATHEERQALAWVHANPYALERLTIVIVNTSCRMAREGAPNDIPVVALSTDGPPPVKSMPCRFCGIATTSRLWGKIICDGCRAAGRN